MRIVALAPPAAESGLAGPLVAAPEALRSRVEQAIAKLSPALAATGARVSDSGTGAAVRVVLTRELAPPTVVARRWSVAAASSRIDRDTITLDALARQVQAGPVYLAATDQPLVASLFADSGGLRPLDAAELPARLSAEPQALAIVPADTAGVHIHVLALDGADPVAGTGDPNNYPLVTRVRVEATHADKASTALAAALAQALAGLDAPPTRLTFTGDVIPTRCVYDEMRRAGDWAAPFRQVMPRLNAADLLVGSLDASISDVGQPIGCEETFNLLAAPQVVQGLQQARFKVLTVATNHAKDCGRSQFCADRALLDTLSNLRAAGIEPAGGGRNDAEARRPAIVIVHGTRFAFLGYDDVAAYYHATATAAGTAGLDLSRLAGEVQAAARSADVVIVLPHWGVEYTPDPSDRQRQAAKIAIDAGATMVVGNHPHVVEAAGPIGNGYVAYALDNFVFDQDWSVETTEGVVLEAVFRGSTLAEVRFLPEQIEQRLRPVFLDASNGGEGAAILKRIIDATARLPSSASR